jgi:hypothetical protein
MKRTTLIAAGLALVLGTGCILTSVYPFYFEKDVVFDPALLGTWQKAGQADEHWKFERDKANGYRITVLADGKPSLEQGQLFKLQGQMFLDLCAHECKEDIQPEPVPSHLLLRVDQLTPTLKLTGLDYNWLKELLAQNPSALRHLLLKTGDNPTDRRIVLTADTAELQQFVIKHLKTEGAWTDPLELQPAEPKSR